MSNSHSPTTEKQVLTSSHREQVADVNSLKEATAARHNLGLHANDLMMAKMPGRQATLSDQVQTAQGAAIHDMESGFSAMIGGGNVRSVKFSPENAAKTADSGILDLSSNPYSENAMRVADNRFSHQHSATKGNMADTAYEHDHDAIQPLEQV